MSLLQFSVTVMGVETRAKDREELKEKLLKEEALKKQQRADMKIKPNQVRYITIVHKKSLKNEAICFLPLRLSGLILASETCVISILPKLLWFLCKD